MKGRSKGTFAVMAVLVMLACALVTAQPSDAEPSDSYVVDMRTGDTFTYEPKTNLDSVITASALEGMTFTDGIMTASFDAVDLTGSLATTITARWTSEEGSLSQVASQRIAFMVHPHVTVDGSSSKEIVRGIIGGAKAGTIVYQPEVSEASAGTATEVSCSIIENEWVGWDENEKRLFLKKDVPVDVASSTMSPVISAVNRAVDSGSTLKEESVAVTVSIVIGSGLMIISDDVIETKQSEADPAKNTYTVKTNADTASGLTVTECTFDTSGLPEGLVKSIDGQSIVFDPSVVDFPAGAAGDDAVKEFAFTVTVKGLADGQAVEASKKVVLKVFADMVYTTVPSVSDVTVMPDPADSKKILLSAVVKDAKSITIDWRDGATSTPDFDGSDRYSASHVFSKDGRYTIVLEAQNDAGSKCCYIRYDTSTREFEIVEEDEPSEGFFEKHGWLFLLFAVLALLCVVVYAVLYPAPIVLILAGLFALLSVLTYLY